ncbi:hypothetical protein N1851_027798 [Merluccius polli]|uniref:Uncharacterized protein n=1 Tax=Merluccius polli TaxID=89951 RepID=A0AA47NS27_MERPO|nr:hypothetical protein N1851_027798 [Merluccius polli]
MDIKLSEETWAKKNQPEVKVGQSKYYTAPDKMPVPKQKRVKKKSKGRVKSDDHKNGAINSNKALDPSSNPDTTQENATESQVLRLTTEKINSKKKESLIQGNVHKSESGLLSNVLESSHIPDGTPEKAAEGDATTIQTSADTLPSEVCDKSLST